MNRTISCIAIVVAVIVWNAPAHADDAPTEDQLEAAKTAFDDGTALYDAGKIAESIERFKESYRLSRNVVVLYNIGHAYDKAGQKAKALAFYVKFLAEAPATVAMHDDVQKRVDELTKAHVSPDLSATYSQADFHHQVVESVPPGKPFDVTAVVPEEFRFTVTLFYRSGGEETFTAVPMKRGTEGLTGRIPAEKITGTSIQYYLEVKDQAGSVVARSGRATSPNLVNIEGAATAQPRPTEEDPLRAIKNRDQPPPARFGAAKWISTSIATALVGGTVTMYLLAKNHSDKLLSDSMSCGVPPCREFDQAYDQGIESKGVRYNTLYQIGVGASISAIVVAGYFWYRAATSHRDQRVGLSKPPTATWAIGPALGGGFTGAAAVARF